ncbi:MAG: acyl-CoA dehydrogenase family protein, partial [Chloroflexota bacterium]
MDFALGAHHLEIQRLARAAAEEVVEPAAKVSDEQRIFDRSVIDALAARGLVGLSLPVALGGGGEDHLAMCLV